MAEAPIALDELMKVANTVTGLASNAAQVITKNTEQMLGIQTERERALAAAIPDEVAVGVQKSAAELNAIQNARKAASAFAVNMDDANQMVTALGKQHTEATTKALQIADEIRQRKSVMPWESPIEFIKNQIVIPFKIDEYNANAQKANLTAAVLEQANKAVHSQAVTENTIKQTLTVETQAAQQRLLQAAAEDKLAQLKLQGITLNTGNVKAVYEMTSAQLDSMLKINQVFNSQEYLHMAQETHKINAARWGQELKDKQEIAAEEQNIADTINAGRAALNLPKLPSKKIREQLKMSPEIRKVLEQNYITGAAIISSGAPSVGDSPAKAAEIIVSSHAPLTTEQQGIKKFLIDSVTEAATTIPPTIDTKANPKAAADYVNTTVIEAAKRQEKNIKTGDASNIYAATSLKAIAEAASVKDSQIYTQVLKPFLDTGYDKVDPEDIVSKTIAGIQQGTIKYDQATLGIAAVFRTAAAVNNETRRYRMFGLPNQTGYPVKFTQVTEAIALGGGAFTTTIDMTDPAQVSIYLSRRMAAQIADQTRFLWPTK